MRTPSYQTETLVGTLDRIIFTNEENHYTVAELTPERPAQAGAGRRKTEPVTIVGNLAAVQCGETLRLRGHWVSHRQFGRQFKVESYESVLPATTAGLVKYLGSGLIKGIGPTLAARIVNHFGTDTLRIIDGFSARLCEVEGIGTERARRIRAAWLAQKAVREIMIFLQSYGISTSQAAKIYKTYGDDAIEVVKQNPYRLAADIYGIGFKTADRIAANIGIAREASFRLQAGLRYALETATEDGHTCLPLRELLAISSELLGLGKAATSTDQNKTPQSSGQALELALASLAAAGDVVVEPVSFWEAPPHGSIQPESFVFLRWLHRAECGVAEKLRAIARAPVGLPSIKLDKAIEWVQLDTGITLAPAQQQAVKTALASKLTVITGGPGVGKTTVVNSIVRILKAKRCKVVLAAPTGRAAKRLSEATDSPAQTIHRLLKYDPSKQQFVYDENTPLKADMLIVDETSMLDVPLAHALLRAVPESTSVVFVGDADQLPSVGPGNFLLDVITSRIASVVRLTEIFRQAQGSLIITNAHRINRGELPQTATSGPIGEPAKGQYTDKQKPLSDFYFIEQDDPQKAAELICRLVTERIPKRFGFDPVTDVQVLTPMHKGECGAVNLNRLLQSALHPQVARRRGGAFPGVIERFGRLYRVGDKVMQLRNNYDKDVFNGDLGIVTDIDLTEQILTARIDERDVRYDFTDLDELAPAYAVTVHKAQGSEYPCVVVPILTQHYVLLQRNLLYTAVTRGRRLVILVGSKKALAIAVRNTRTARRYSRLAERLRS